MNRRKFMAGLGVGIGVNLAGCMNTVSGDDEPEDNDDGSTLASLEKIRNVNYDARVEDGKQTQNHNINSVGIRNITDRTMELVCDVSVNPVDDYEIKLHYTTLTSSSSGYWNQSPRTDLRHIEPIYDEETDTWVPQDMDSKQVQYNLDNDEMNYVIDTVTIPSGIFWGEDDSLEMAYGNHMREDVMKTQPTGFPTVLEFDLSDMPMYETGVFSLTWIDKNNDSSHENELMTHTKPVIRVSEDEYIYPSEDGYYNNNSLDVAYRNEFASQDSSTTSQITRTSNYGYFSDKYEKFRSDESNKVDVGSKDNPAYLDTLIQVPWSIAYEISDSTKRNADSIGDSAIVGDGLGYHSVHSFVNDSEIMNHNEIKTIASKLGDVCDMMDATHPTEQVRVVADFVQYMSHYADDSGVSTPVGLVSETSHPVVTAVTGEGDCKDFTILGNAILQQEPFDMDTDVFVIENITGLRGDTSVSHVSTAIPVSELGGDEFVQNLNNHVAPIGMEQGLAEINGEQHVYVEMSGPWNIGYVQNDWLDNNSLEHIDNVV